MPPSTDEVDLGNNNKLAKVADVVEKFKRKVRNEKEEQEKELKMLTSNGQAQLPGDMKYTREMLKQATDQD